MTSTLSRSTTAHIHGCFELPPLLLKPNSEPQTQLVTQLRLLHLLHHRNKNQHRRSIWYRHVDHFRREVKKLCQDLAIDLGPGFSVSQTRSKSSTRLVGIILPTNSSGTSKDHPTTVPVSTLKRTTSSPQRAATRATARLNHWLTIQLPTRTYTSITSLSSIPSFAPLALVLLAIFARICSVTGMTSHLQALGAAEEEKNAEREEQELVVVLERFAKEDAGVLSERAVGDGDIYVALDDVGVAVAREAPPAATVQAKHTLTEPVEKEPKKRRKRADAIGDLFAGL